MKTPEKRPVLGRAALAAGGGLTAVFLLTVPVRWLLERFGLTYRPWVMEGLYLLACLCGGTLTVCLLTALLRLTGWTGKRRCQTVLARLGGWIGSAALMLALPVGIYLALLGYAFLYTPEHEVLLEGRPVVACVRSFLQVTVEAHGYRSPLIMSLEYERFDYGSGGYDPFDSSIPAPFEALPE